MHESVKPLSHPDANHCDDATLRREADDHLKRSAPLQFMGELYGKLRETTLDWWSFPFLAETWGPHVRMEWLRDRADLRQSITSSLTGLPRKTARYKSTAFQADVIESVLANDDIDARTFDLAFDANDLVIYGSARAMWDQFRNRLPCEQDVPAHQRLVAWLLRALLLERPTGANNPRRSILTSLDVRSAIDPTVWHDRIPREFRVAADQLRLKTERSRPREPFHARNELTVVTPEIIAQHVPLADLMPIIDAADAALSFADEMESHDRVSGPHAVTRATNVPFPALRRAV